MVLGAADLWIANTVIEEPYAGWLFDPRDPSSARVDMPLLYRLRTTTGRAPRPPP